MEDLRTITGPWECEHEECGERMKTNEDILKHIRSDHPESHVSTVNIRHVKSRRRYPISMLYKHVVSCGVDGCNTFSSRNCSLENALLDMKHHFEQHHQEEELCCNEVIWLEDDKGNDHVILRKVAKRKRLKPRTLRRQKMRIRNLGSAYGKKKGPNYTKEEIRKGTLIMFKSLRTYKLLRKLYPDSRFPHPVTNRRHIKQFICGWGVQQEMFHLFSIKLQDMEDADKNISLSFDEMDLLAKTTYSQRHKVMVPKAKKANVVMARGLGRGFKEVLFYDFDTPMTMDLLNKIIKKAEEAGAHVRSLVLDMGNQKLLSELGVYKGEFKFPHPTRDEEIVIIPDTPHCLKNLRSNLFNNGVEFDYYGEKVNFTKKHFEDLFESDSQLGELRMCHKIK